jgi:hypothetical protein
MAVKPQEDAALTLICLFDDPGEMKSLEKVTEMVLLKPVYVVILLEAG